MRRAHLLPCCLALLTGAAPARADDTADLRGLLDEPVISTASRTAETSSTAPATSSVLTAEEMSRYGIRSLEDGLNFLSLGMLTERPMHTVEIGARGVLLHSDYGAHVLLMVNGNAVNEQWDGAAYYDRGVGVPWELVDHVEVILGPGSVLYGSNAMLGVINIVTKRARDFRGAHGVLEATPATAVRGGVGWGAEFRAFGQPGELTVMLDHYASRGPRSSFGPQEVGLDAVTGEPKRFSFDGLPTGIWGGTTTRTPYAQVPSAYLRAVLGDFALDVRGTLFQRASATGWGTFDDPANMERDRWLQAALRFEHSFTSELTLSARAYASWYDYLQHAPAAAAEDCLEGQDHGCAYHLVGEARWVGTEVVGSFDWLRDGRMVTLAGLDARLRHVFQDERYLDALTGQGDPIQYRRVEWALGAYVEQTARPARWLALNAGLRLDSDRRYGAHLSPRMAATLSPLPDTALKVIYAQAFRSPSAYERYYSDPQGFVASPGLQPEVVRSVEAALEQRLGAQRLRLALFRAWWDDLIVSDAASAQEIAEAQARGELEADVTWAGRYRNVAALDNVGANAGVEGSFLDGRLRHALGLTVARARQDLGPGTTPEQLVAAASVFGNARLSLQPAPDLPTAAIAVRYAGRRPVAGSSRAVPPLAPSQVEARATLSGAMPLVPGVSWSGGYGYQLHPWAPYVLGPLEARSDTGQPELSPLRQHEVFVLLRYDQP